MRRLIEMLNISQCFLQHCLEKLAEEFTISLAENVVRDIWNTEHSCDRHQNRNFHDSGITVYEGHPNMMMKIGTNVYFVVEVAGGTEFVLINLSLKLFLSRLK